MKWVWIRNHRYLGYELGIVLRPCLSNNTRDWWWSLLGSVPVSVRLCRGAAMIWILQSDLMFKSTSHYRRILQTLQPHSWFSSTCCLTKVEFFPQRMTQRIWNHISWLVRVWCIINSFAQDLTIFWVLQAVSSPPKEDPPVPAATEVVAEPEADQKKISSEVCLVLMT